MVESQTNRESAESGGQSPLVEEPSAEKSPEHAADQRISGGREEQSGRRFSFLRKYFWLDDKLAVLHSAGWWMSQSGMSELVVASQARDGFAQLGDRQKHCLAVVILQRTELLLLLRSLMKQRGLECSGISLDENEWKAAEQVIAIRDMLSGLNHHELSALKACLARGGELSLGGLGTKQRRRMVRCLRQAMRLLMGSLNGDDEEVARLKKLRWIRLGTVAAVVLCLLGITAANYENRRRGPNIALNRPTKASSTYPTEFFHCYKLSDAAQVVNGKRAMVGVHTTLETNPFVTIDLGTPQSFNEVVVYNRNDCCNDRGLPLAIEVSDDDRNYRVIAEQRNTFLIWTAKNLRARGRYVRLRAAATTYLHLAEVEIYKAGAT